MANADRFIVVTSHLIGMLDAKRLPAIPTLGCTVLAYHTATDSLETAKHIAMMAVPVLPRRVRYA
jgi:hypothetical protein